MTLEMKARSLLQSMMGGEAYQWGNAAAFAYGAAFEDALETLPHRIFILNSADELQAATRRATALVRNGAVIEKPDWGHGLLEVHAQALTQALADEVSALLSLA